MVEQALKTELQTKLETELNTLASVSNTGKYTLSVSNDINYDILSGMTGKRVSVIIKTSAGVKSNIAGVDAAIVNLFLEVACIANDLQEVMVALNNVAEDINGTTLTDGSYNCLVKLDNPSSMGGPVSAKINNAATKVSIINWTGEALCSTKQIFDTNKYYISLDSSTYTEIKYITSFVRDFEITTENQPMESAVFTKQSPIAMGTTYSFNCLHIFDDALFTALVAMADSTSFFNTTYLKFKIGSNVVSVQNIKVTTASEIGKIPTITITLIR